MTRDLERELRAHFAHVAGQVPADTTTMDELREPPLADGSELTVSRSQDANEGARPRFLVSAAASVLLLAGVVGVWLVRPQSAQHTGAGVPAHNAFRPIPSTVPAGFKLSGVSDITYQVVPMSVATVYRDPSLPLGSPAVMVLVSQDASLPDGTAVNIDGRQAVQSEQNGVEALSWKLGSGGTVQLTATGLTPTQVLDAARSLRTSGEAVTTIGHLPAKFVPVAHVRASAPKEIAAVSYENGSGRSFGVVARMSDAGDLETYAVATGGTFSPTSVAGHGAYLVVGPASNYRRLVWEQEGSIVEVSGIGFSDAQIASLADRVRGSEASEWAGLLSASGQRAETVTSLVPGACGGPGLDAVVLAVSASQPSSPNCGH
ncbi:MAG: hypothetical protein JWM34_1073 [Ilumatobacteraceae bacterium]|nr:hypothetical protein [Ilumatobacteraceae bacterium]